MASLTSRSIDGGKEWKRAVHDPSYVVSFGSKAEEEAYEKRDALLNSRINAVVRRHLGRAAKEKASVSDDWWPSRCRYVDLALSALSRDLIETLRNLLDGEFRRWRVQVTVYGDILKGTTEVGALMIYADKVLVERAVLKGVDLTAKLPG